jgi:hypothetical protein
MREEVLKHAQRAYYRTIDASHEQGKHHPEDNDTDVHGQDGRQELYLCQPANPSSCSSRQVEEEQSDAQPAQKSQDNARFLQHIELKECDSLKSTQGYTD